MSDETPVNNEPISPPPETPPSPKAFWKRTLAVLSAFTLVGLSWGAVAEDAVRVNAQNLGIGLALLAVLGNRLVHRFSKRPVTWRSRGLAAFLGATVMHLGTLQTPSGPGSATINFHEALASDATLFGWSIGFGLISAVVVNLLAYPFESARQLPTRHKPESPQVRPKSELVSRRRPTLFSPIKRLSSGQLGVLLVVGSIVIGFLFYQYVTTPGANANDELGSMRALARMQEEIAGYERQIDSLKIDSSQLFPSDPRLLLDPEIRAYLESPAVRAQLKRNGGWQDYAETMITITRKEQNSITSELRSRTESRSRHRPWYLITAAALLFALAAAAWIRLANQEV